MLHDFNRELELSDRLETEYLRILNYDFPGNYTGVYKSREYTRLCTIIEGEKTVSVNHKKSINYDSGKFLLMPRESFVDMKISKPTKALVFELNNTLIKKASENISTDYKIDCDTLTEDKFLFADLSPQLKDILGKIHTTLELKDCNSKYILDLLAQELVYYLVKVKGANQILSVEINNPINQAIRYMEKEYMTSISIQKIANELCMSEANFSQYFKKIIGISPKEYLTHLKMKKAKEILEHESVTDAAYDLGYENISNFIEAFKNRYGVTPKQYKKRAGY